MNSDKGNDVEPIDDSSEDRRETDVQAIKPGEQVNPLGDELNIMVSIPELIEIKMVNASILSDYEIWFFISSILASIMTGFWVAFVQNTIDSISGILFWNSVIFTLFFLISVYIAFNRRKKLNEKAKNIEMKASKVSEKK